MFADIGGNTRFIACETSAINPNPAARNNLGPGIFFFQEDPPFFDLPIEVPTITVFKIGDFLVEPDP
jgi:hypothetical protein